MAVIQLALIRLEQSPWKSFPYVVGAEESQREWDEAKTKGREGEKERKQEWVNLAKADKTEREKKSKRPKWRKRSARVRARPQATGRLVCLATISQSQDRLR